MNTLLQRSLPSSSLFVPTRSRALVSSLFVAVPHFIGSQLSPLDLNSNETEARVGRTQGHAMPAVVSACCLLRCVYRSRRVPWLNEPVEGVDRQWTKSAAHAAMEGSPTDDTIQHTRGHTTCTTAAGGDAVAMPVERMVLCRLGRGAVAPVPPARSLTRLPRLRELTAS
jgi:hypothetical protein